MGRYTRDLASVYISDKFNYFAYKYNNAGWAADGRATWVNRNEPVMGSDFLHCGEQFGCS